MVWIFEPYVQMHGIIIQTKNYNNIMLVYIVTHDLRRYKSKGGNSIRKTAKPYDYVF